jgi:hypothetical protein
MPRLKTNGSSRAFWEKAKIAGESVSKAEWCRERARDCAKLASAAMDDRAKAMLEDMAGVWLRLADWREQRSAKVVCEEQGTAPISCARDE